MIYYNKIKGDRIINKNILAIGITILFIFSALASISIGYNENIDVCFGKIKDGRGLTIEICNNGGVDVENIQIKVDIENGKLIIIPKKRYEISFLAAGESTEVFINIFGFNLGRLFGYPIITLTLSLSAVDLTWKRISATIFGTHTNIFEECSISDEPFEGFTLFGPEYSKYTYLINNNGRIVHYWKSDYIQGFGTYLMENGDLFRLDLPGANPVFHGGGIAGRVEKFDEKSNLLWEFEYSNSEHCSHHDIEPLPNGNVLLIAWEFRTREEAIAAGRNPNRLKVNFIWPDHIIEVEPAGSSSGNIVWEWHVWDHLIQDFDPRKKNYGVVEDHPELIDFNFGNTIPDWNHINYVDYNEEFDQILLSVLYFSEIWVIDHSTTTVEAAGHTGGRYGKGGDLLYRWGNPQAYKAGTPQDQKYFGQHGASWVEKGCPGEGNILVFNNGLGGRQYSTVDEIVPPVDSNGYYFYTPGKAYDPKEQIWIYTAENPMDLFSMTLSNAQRLPNGNTLICSGNQGLFLEVTPEKKVVWQYQNILSPAVARAYRYPLDYPGIPEVKSKSINFIGNDSNELVNLFKNKQQPLFGWFQEIISQFPLL